MICCFCHFNNYDGDHRCNRCGRRMPAPGQQTQPYVQGSAALALHSYQAPAEEMIPVPEIKRGARVIPIDILDQRFRQSAPPVEQAYPLPEPGQPSVESEADQLALPAHWAHRMIAFALDSTLIAAGVGMFAGALALMDVPIVFTPVGIVAYVACLALFGFLYEALWAIAGVDSPGCRWAHLELLDLDGHRAEPRQRWTRMIGRYVSVAAAGLGVLWSLVDDYGLSWHDYMSNSYLTPVRKKH